MYDPEGTQPQWANVISRHAKGTFLYQWAVKATQNGWFSSLFYAAGFVRDYKGVYHARQDALQQYGGYNDFYDYVFDLGTSMLSEKFSFSYNGTEYMLWAWKGDYLNLGAGAELGIYYGGGPHWLVDTSLAMPMAMWVSYGGSNIILYMPSEVQWWVTGFNPYYQNINAEDLTVTYWIVFTNPGMFNAFYSKYDGYSQWMFSSLWNIAIYKF